MTVCNIVSVIALNGPVTAESLMSTELKIIVLDHPEEYFFP